MPQQPEIVLAQADEDVLRDVLDIGAVAADHPADAREDQACEPGDEGIPGGLVAAQQAGKVLLLPLQVSPVRQPVR